MSTPACIIIKVRKSDIGKTIKFDASKLPTEQGTWSDNTSSSPVEFSKEITIEKPYLSIYVHWDGDSLKEILDAIYNDYDKALNLILGGDCSSIDVDNILRYATRDCEDWEYIQPRQGDTFKDVLQTYCLYTYKFYQGHWVKKK